MQVQWKEDITTTDLQMKKFKRMILIMNKREQRTRQSLIIIKL